MGHEYNEDFYNYISTGSRNSARTIVPILLEALKPATMADIGGGNGVWAAVWESHEVAATLVDGAYVKNPQVADFRAADLTEPLTLGQKFDLLQCVEVAEHLPPTAAAGLVKSLTSHANIVVFSAATPGQGGEHHINEQSLEYWRQLFAQFDFKCFDFIRPKISQCREVMPWYRYNMLLYVHEQAIRNLPADVRASQVEHIQSLGGLRWKLRHAVVRLLPRPLVNHIAVSLARVRSASSGL